MEIKGKVVAKPAPKSGVSSKGPWKKVFLVIEYEGGQYPKQILLSNMNKAEDFDRIRIGDTGVFKFDGKVQERNGNYYLDLNCWSWNIDQVSQPQQTANYPNGPI